MSKKIHIYVMTTDREEPTLESSLQSLKKSVGESAVITVVPDENPKLGCFKHYDRCLNMGIKDKAPFIAVFPDDMLYSPGWVERTIEKLKDKTVGYVAQYLPHGLGKRLHFAKGWNQTHGGWDSSYGGCYVFTLATAKKIVKNKFYINHLENYKANKQIDHCIPEVMHLLKLKQYWWAPSVAEHIGKTSTIGHVHTFHENPFKPR